MSFESWKIWKISYQMLWQTVPNYGCGMAESSFSEYWINSVDLQQTLAVRLQLACRGVSCWTAWKHSGVHDVELSSLSAMYRPSCMSSANCTWLTPNDLMTFASGDMYSVSSSGPSTNHCGTPYSQTMLDDCFCPTRTDWERHTRYELTQQSAGPDIP